MESTKAGEEIMDPRKINQGLDEQGPFSDGLNEMGGLSSEGQIGH